MQGSEILNMLQHDETLTKHDTALTKHDTALTKHDIALQQHDETLKHQGEVLNELIDKQTSKDAIIPEDNEEMSRKR